MTTTRRSILSALLVAPLAKLWPKIRGGESNVGLSAATKINRACEYPTAYSWRTVDVLTMAELMKTFSECQRGNESPKIIYADLDAWREIWNNLSPMDRRTTEESELRRRGWMTYSLFGAEVVGDAYAMYSEIWFINPDHPDNPLLNAVLTFNSIDIHPRPYTPPTPEEIAEWGEELEAYADED